jgi:undecaprenyl-diphosphatase
MRPKIRLGYVSGDLCTHAVGLLMPDVLEAHDKHSFEVFAWYRIAFGIVVLVSAQMGWVTWAA